MVVHVSCTHYRVRFVLRRGNVSNRRCSHSTRLRRPASASPLKRKIPLSRRTEGWNPGPSFHQLSHLFLEFCAALFSSLVPFDLSSISLHYLWTLLLVLCGSYILHNLSLPFSSQSCTWILLKTFFISSGHKQYEHNTKTTRKQYKQWRARM